MRHIKLVTLLTLLSLISFKATGQQDFSKILFCYGDLFPEDVSGYDLVVLEPVHFSRRDISILKKQNTKVLAYISLGEVNEAAAHFKHIMPYTLGENDVWNSHIINIENSETIHALNKLINVHLIYQGFDGLFLDNIDNYTYWGPTPHKLPELIEFLQRLKMAHPESYILQNAGLLILEHTKPFINAVAVESVATDYNFNTHSYKLRDKDEFETQLDYVVGLKKKFNLPMIFIEYAKTKKEHHKIDKRLQETSLPYFIGTIDLQTIPKTYD